MLRVSQKIVTCVTSLKKCKVFFKIYLFSHLKSLKKWSCEYLSIYSGVLELLVLTDRSLQIVVMHVTSHVTHVTLHVANKSNGEIFWGGWTSLAAATLVFCFKLYPNLKKQNWANWLISLVFCGKIEKFVMHVTLRVSHMSNDVIARRMEDFGCSHFGILFQTVSLL